MGEKSLLDELKEEGKFVKTMSIDNYTKGMFGIMDIIDQYICRCTENALSFCDPNTINLVYISMMESADVDLYEDMVSFLVQVTFTNRYNAVTFGRQLRSALNLMDGGAIGSDNKDAVEAIKQLEGKCNLGISLLGGENGGSCKASPSVIVANTEAEKAFSKAYAVCTYSEGMIFRYGSEE